jgi:hypothetical protein
VAFRTPSAWFLEPISQIREFYRDCADCHGEPDRVLASLARHLTGFQSTTVRNFGRVIAADDKLVDKLVYSEARPHPVIPMGCLAYRDRRTRPKTKHLHQGVSNDVNLVFMHLESRSSIPADGTSHLARHLCNHRMGPELQPVCPVGRPSVNGSCLCHDSWL